MDLSRDGTLSFARRKKLVGTNRYSPSLRPGTTYYWRVDTVRGDDTTTAGTVWKFTTAK